MPSDTAVRGPVLPEQISEVQGIFPSDAALQDAVGRLTRAGFDRADLSLPVASPSASQATPSQGAANPNTEDDTRQSRTLHSSLAASAGAMLGAGLTVATGGAALVAAAAAAGVGAAAGGVVEAAHRAADGAQHTERESAAAAGQLVLAVRATRPADASRAEQLMREAGASRVESVQRTGGALG